MKASETGRRQFLRLLISLPMTFGIGCDSELAKASVQAAPLSPEESLKKLIRLLGPWSAPDKEKAEVFAARFVESKHAVAPYLPGSSELVQSLASRFPAQIMAVKEIDLRNVPAKERELLVQLAAQLYSLIEVRFIASDEPPWGSCQSDTMRYTRAPK